MYVLSFQKKNNKKNSQCGLRLWSKDYLQLIEHYQKKNKKNRTDVVEWILNLELENLGFATPNCRTNRITKPWICFLIYRMGEYTILLNVHRTVKIKWNNASEIFYELFRFRAIQIRCNYYYLLKGPGITKEQDWELNIILFLYYTSFHDHGNFRSCSLLIVHKSSIFAAHPEMLSNSRERSYDKPHKL